MTKTYVDMYLDIILCFQNFLTTWYGRLGGGVRRKGRWCEGEGGGVGGGGGGEWKRGGGGGERERGGGE